LAKTSWPEPLAGTARDAPVDVTGLRIPRAEAESMASAQKKTAFCLGKCMSHNRIAGDAEIEKSL
jgi:hypothetical protein